MRRSPVLVLAALLLPACAGHTPRPATADAAAVAAEIGPLAVRLAQPFGRRLAFELNRPAYVAIFEVVPGRGMSLVYPAAYDYGATRPLPAGYNAVFAAPYNVGRWFYATTYQARSLQPPDLYLIASEAPLRIDEIVRHPEALRRAVGVVNFSQLDGQRMMDVLDEQIVGAVPDDAWATDYVALWPDVPPPPPPLASVQRFLVQCADGRGYLVDPSRPASLAVCGGARVQRVTPPDSAARRDSSATPNDTSTTPAAKTRRYEPPPMALVVDYGAPAPDAAAPAERSAGGLAARGTERADAERGRFARERTERMHRPWDWPQPRSNEPDRAAFERTPRPAPRAALPAAQQREPATPRAEPRAEPRSEPRRDPSAAPHASPQRSAEPQRANTTERSQ